MAYYDSEIALSVATATDLHTAGQDEELVQIRVVADATTSAQKMTFYKQVSAVDYELGYLEIPAIPSVMGVNSSPFVGTFVVPKIFLANGNKIRVKSENTDAFNLFCVTRDPI